MIGVWPVAGLLVGLWTCRPYRCTGEGDEFTRMRSGTTDIALPVEVEPDDPVEPFAYVRVDRALRNPVRHALGGPFDAVRSEEDLNPRRLQLAGVDAVHCQRRTGRQRRTSRAYPAAAYHRQVGDSWVIGWLPR